MPLIAIDVVEGLGPERHRALVREVSAVVAEVIESPVERLRVRVNAVPLDQWGVGGVPAAEVAGAGTFPDAEQAPMIAIDLLQGRPESEHVVLLARVSATVAEIVGCGVDRVRMRINEVPPALWGIGGVPAAAERADEVKRRRQAADRAS